MKRVSKIFLGMLLVVPLVWATPLFAQCGGNLLACLDEENPNEPFPQRLAISVWTNDVHCPASGHIGVMCEPMPYYEFGPYVDSFFDVFTTPHRVKPSLYQIMEPPPYTTFYLEVAVDFDDPALTDLEYVEQVMWDPGPGKLVIVHPTPCYGDDVPAFMYPMTAACFKVCHRIYYVDLGSSLDIGRPNISVVPGCGMSTNCSYDPCVPGGEIDYVYNVYSVGGRWVLEFEYSNPNAEPRCYCVSYTGNQPQNYDVHGLAALSRHAQTLDLTLWTEQPGDLACGIQEVFSYPTGGYIGYPEPMFSATDEKRTWSVPIGPGSFAPGEEFQIIAYLDYGPPEPCEEYEDQWLVEHVRVTPEMGLELVDYGGECDEGAVYVPDTLRFGIPECITVCHDIYHIPLEPMGPGTPEVAVYPGCDPSMTPCSDPTCNPGGPFQYRYDLIQMGGSWGLEFEHSFPENEPACYCIEFYYFSPLPTQPILLAAMDFFSSELQLTLNGSGDCMWPLNGQVTVTSNPYGALDPDYWVESFFDVFCTPHSWRLPVQPGPMMSVGDNFQIEISADFFGPGSDPFDGVIYCENVVVTPTGGLALWDPSSPCTGDNVPSNMAPDESACFEVCHRIYEIPLNVPPGEGEPIINVTPGCEGPPMDNCEMTPCVPGGPYDFVYEVYFNGMDWILRFEYSNPYVEPVCYCVTYDGNRPLECESHELMALDEEVQTEIVSLKLVGTEPICVGSGTITMNSTPPGAYIGPYPTTFGGVEEDWHSVEVPVGPGSFLPGETFQVVAWIHYDSPNLPDAYLADDILVTDDPLMPLVLLDLGGECTGDDVPSSMDTGTSECFKVCHRIYHIPIPDATDPGNPPTVTVIPGCYGPPQDPCMPDPECMPGGEFDYRYDLRWRDGFWELEFEYSNEQIEPVCYCVSVEAEQEPCETHKLVAFDAENQLLQVSLMALDASGIEPCEVSGTITVSANPPDLYFEQTSWTFSGVGDTWVTYGKPTAPEPYNPSSLATITVEIDYDDPDQPDEIETEIVEMDLGGLVPFDVGGECDAGGGPQVPSELVFGDPECFIVCHDVYYIPLVFTGPGIPVVTVTPGCDMTTPCNDPIACTPGGPYDYRYDVFKVGGTWILEFEYSNENIEPVCYCVEINSVTSVPNEAYLLASLDEDNQEFDLTIWTFQGMVFGDGSMDVTVEPGVTTTIPFTGVGTEYTTWEIPVGIGTLTEGQTFQLTVAVQFDEPGIQPLYYEETVIVTPPGTLMRWDPITPCVGDAVPVSMDDNTAECFVVCHKIYDILLNTPPSAFPPTVTITPGCFGPPFDDCLYHPECRPGGPNDYCYRFWDDGVNWHLIFEYSNPYKEPVCYCVTIGEGPCWPVSDLVLQAPDPDAGAGMRLAWTAPETAVYIIYSTTDASEEGSPPGGTWQFEDVITGTAGTQVFWYPPAGDLAVYRKYSIIVDCSPPTR